MTHDRILMKIRESVSNSNYNITSHAHRAMFDDELTIVDVEHAILTGRIIEKQSDAATGDTKYLLHGETPWSDIEIALAFGTTGMLNIITVYTTEG